MKQSEIQKAFDDLLKKYHSVLQKLHDTQDLLEQKPKEVIVEGPRRPVTIEKPATGDLREAARLLTKSDFNKEDLSEKEIFDILTKLSEEEVNTTLGFWAVPLPTHENTTDTKPRYSRKK